MNLFDMLKADKGIPVSDPMARLWGYQYRKKHSLSEISGVPPLHFTSREEQLLDYRIYGNTVQDGTPTPENPVEVQGCGEYDAELNGYKIPVTVSDGTSSITTPVYIGSEPLHKIGDYADYVDFKRGVVVRRIKKLVLKGNEAWYGDSSGTVHQFFTHDERLGGVLSSAYSTITPYGMTVYNRNGDYGCYTVTDGDDIAFQMYGVKADMPTKPDWKSYLGAQYFTGTPVTVWYVLAEPEEEPLENLLPIRTIKGTNILTVGTTVQPSNIWIKGKIKAID